jgi:transcriptional regulator with XRE-family HTH domain
VTDAGHLAADGGRFLDGVSASAAAYVRLYGWRLDKGLSQRATAKKVGVSFDLYQRIEGGEVEPDDETAEKIGALTDGAVVFGAEISVPAESPPAQPEGGGGASDRARPAAKPGALERARPGADPAPAAPDRAEAVLRHAASGAAARALAADGPGRPGFAIARHAGGQFGLVLIARNSVVPLSIADAQGMASDLATLTALLGKPDLFGPAS